MIVIPFHTTHTAYRVLSHGSLIRLLLFLFLFHDGWCLCVRVYIHIIFDKMACIRYELLFLQLSFLFFNILIAFYVKCINYCEICRAHLQERKMLPHWSASIVLYSMYDENFGMVCVWNHLTFRFFLFKRKISCNINNTLPLSFSLSRLHAHIFFIRSRLPIASLYVLCVLEGQN